MFMYSANYCIVFIGKTKRRCFIRLSCSFFLTERKAIIYYNLIQSKINRTMWKASAYTILPISHGRQVHLDVSNDVSVLFKGFYLINIIEKNKEKFLLVFSIDRIETILHLINKDISFILISLVTSINSNVIVYFYEY